MADEEDFLNLLIASERVEGWLATVRDSSNASRVMQAMEELAAAVEAKEAYAEEARLAGAVAILTRFLKRTEDEHLLELASNVIAACSGPMAVAGTVRTFRYGGTPVVIKEAALGDGVGARVWVVSHTLCREMAAHPEMVKGQDVLEIGAGCGACGILAAKLGARQVFLTDYLEPILANLRACVHLNAPQLPPPPPAQAAGEASAAAARASVAAAAHGGEDDSREDVGDCEELFDPEDASECSDLDDFFGEAAGGGTGRLHQQGQQQQEWDVANMHVRSLDWAESVGFIHSRDPSLRPDGQHKAHGHHDSHRHLYSPRQQPEGPAAAAAAGAGAGAADRAEQDAVGCGAAGAPEAPAPAPGIGPEERFPVVLGTDILYEWPMVEMVACVLKHRLAEGGRALLCCAVREQAMFDAFAARLRDLGFRLGMTPVQPRMDDAGILGRDRDYEGGFVMLAAEHAHAPAPAWHRAGLFAE